ncbi:uncharacterized protein [Drosophila suzukii]|uniref:DUF5641 domain-containing protein n=1 Tax=Drosophila suzukii TaxID=28584 RepID=A0ABM4TKK3_DROSZ
MVTSAIHLELVTDLTTETFLAALRRFISLRGKCSKIYSDNGTNFIGAKRSLNEMQELLSSQRHKDIVTSTLADDGIQWTTTYHFLIGRPLSTVPDPDLSHIPVGRLGYWQSIQAMLQGFWNKWHQEYLTTLQQRPKWTTSTPNLSIGDVVFFKESNTPPASWHTARVMETYPGKHNLVQAVKLKT